MIALIDNKNLANKMQEAYRAIDMALTHYRRPVIMCSFGKDSMALLHLVRQVDADIPVLFHREPFFPAKYHFANKVAEAWNLKVYDYPATATSIGCKNGLMEILNHYQVGKSQAIVPTGIDPDSEKRIKKGEQFLCAKEDLLKKPLGTFEFPWDCVLVGHKSSDTDPMWGDLKLHADIRQMPGGADWFFPLRTWTDADIWEYIESYGVPVHLDRYEKVDGSWREKQDKGLNPDYFPACTRCLDKNQPSVVFCPKLKAQITNVSQQVREFDLNTLDYFGGCS